MLEKRRKTIVVHYKRAAEYAELAETKSSETKYPKDQGQKGKEKYIIHVAKLIQDNCRGPQKLFEGQQDSKFVRSLVYLSEKSKTNWGTSNVQDMLVFWSAK